MGSKWGHVEEKDGSKVKSIGCFSEGLGFDPLHIYGRLQPPVSSVRVLPRATDTCMVHIHGTQACMQTKTHKQTNKFKKGKLKV